MSSRSLLLMRPVMAVMALWLVMQPRSHAQEAYPSRPIRIVLPVAAGGATDQLARLIGQGLTERWGRQVVVDNRPGAGTLIASEIVVRSKADGYTLLVTTSTHIMNQLVVKKMPYDTLRDFAPITQAVSLPSLLVAHPAFVKSVKELIAVARARPGEVLYGSAGRGSNPHLAMALFESMAKVRMTHVPYKSGPPSVIDLIAGQVVIIVSGISSSITHVRSGKMRALGVTGTVRSASAPDVPTISEAGLPGYEAMQWYGMMAPAGVPGDIIAMLHKESVAILRTPATVERLAADGSQVIASTPDAFGELIKAESVKWARVAKSAGLTPE